MSAELPVSVLLLLRDEVRDIEELLPALGFAHEVVVVWDPRGDAAARDAAARLGARVFEHAFVGFGAQRQYALERCTQPWVLWIDADERLAPGAAVRLAAAIGDPRAADTWAFRLWRTSFFLGARIRFCGWQRERVTRLFRREWTCFDDAPVHERIQYLPPGGSPASVPPPGATLDVTLEHHSYRTREDCRIKLERYAAANAEKAFRAGRRVMPLDALRPGLRFLRQYVLQLGFLDGWRGALLCWYAAAQVARRDALLKARWREAGR